MILLIAQLNTLFGLIIQSETLNVSPADISSGYIPYLIGALIAAIGAVFTLYKMSEKRVHSQRDKAESDLKLFYENQIKYQQTLIDQKQNDIDKLNEKYFELGSKMIPALEQTNQNTQNLFEIINKLKVNN